MKTEKMMDLSFLSEEEQLALQEVLQRDTALRKLEENRIKKLKKTSFDAKKLRVMTGEWFAEVKSKRFGEISSGIDILKNSFIKKKKIPDVQEVAVKTSKDANVFLSPSPKYQDISSEPDAFKSDKRLLEEAEPVPRTNAMMSPSQLQVTVNRRKPEDEARIQEVGTEQFQKPDVSEQIDYFKHRPKAALDSCDSEGPDNNAEITQSAETSLNLFHILEGDNKPYREGLRKDQESESATPSNKVFLPGIDSSIKAVDAPMSETNPYSDYTIGLPLYSAKQDEVWTPREDQVLQSSRKSPTNLDIKRGGNDQTDIFPVGTEQFQKPDVSEQIDYFKHSPKAALDSCDSEGSDSNVEITQTAETSDHMKGPPVSRVEIPPDSKKDNADTRRRNPLSRNSSTLLSEILQRVKKPQKDDAETAIKSNPTAVQNPVSDVAASESSDIDSLVSSRPSDIKSFEPNTKLYELKGKGQQGHNILDQSSESDRPPSLVNNTSSQIKKPGEYNSDIPNLTFGRGETEHSKRKGILKRSPSTSSTESESLSKWTPVRSTEDTGVMSLLAEDSDGSTRTEPGSKQVRFSAKTPLTNIVEGQKADKTLIKSKTKSTSQQEDNIVSMFPSLSPAQKYKDEPDVDQFLTDNGTTEQNSFPSWTWGENSEAPWRNYREPRNDSSDFSVKTNKPSSVPTASEVSTLPSNDPQNEEYDNFDDLTSESSFGSDILKQTDVSVGSNLQSSKMSGSLLSLYSDAGDFGDVPIQGAVQFKLRYEEAKKEFQVQVIQCRGLAVANYRKYNSDPYVKTYLLPDRSRLSKRKSSVKKSTLNPQYNETLKYKIKKQELQNRTLNLSVWHNDTLGRNVFLGETEVEMSNWDWNDNTANWYSLQSKESNLPDENINQGEICVALKYIPAGSIDGAMPLHGEVHIWLKGAIQLQPLKPDGVDSFVRCYILPDTSKKSRQKTRVVKKTLNPIYNHTMVYDGFKLDEIMEACAELSIWDHETFTNQFLGGVRLNLGTGSSYGRSVDWMDSNEEEAALWQNMITKPNQWVEAILPLRPTLTKRK